MSDLFVLVLMLIGFISVMCLLRYPKAVDKNYTGFTRPKISINKKKLDELFK